VAKSLQYPFYEDYPLVHIAGPLLATGYYLAFSLSHHLVIALAVPNSGDCSGGSVSIDWSDFYASCADIGKVAFLTFHFPFWPFWIFLKLGYHEDSMFYKVTTAVL